MITPDDLLVDALSQAERAATEVAQRHAITALYYATYHVVGKELRVDTARSDSNHARINDHLRKVNGRAAARFNNFRTLRARASYNLDTNIGNQDVGLALSHAAAIRDLLDLPKVPPVPGPPSPAPAAAPV